LLVDDADNPAVVMPCSLCIAICIAVLICGLRQFY